MSSTTTYQKKELFERCPEAYYHKYVEGQSEMASPELEISTIVRAALDHLFKEMESRGKPIKSTAREVKAFADEAIELLATPGVHSKSALDSISPMVRYGLYGLNYDDYFTMQSNMRYEVPLLSKDSLLKGTMNLFLARKDACVEAVAFKTGESLIPAEGDPLLATYALALREMGYSAEQILCKFKFLAKRAEDQATFTEDYLDLLREEYTEHINEVNAALEIGREAFPPMPSWYCSWCGFTGICSVKAEDVQVTNDLGLDNLRGLAARTLVMESYISKAKEILKSGALKNGFVEVNGEYFANWENATTNYDAQEIYHLLQARGEDPFKVLSVDKQKLKRLMNGSLGYEIQDLARSYITHSFGHKSEQPIVVEELQTAEKIQGINFLEKENTSSDAA